MEASTQSPPSEKETPPLRTAKPPPPPSQYLIRGARLPWVDESKLQGTRVPRE